MKSLQLATHSSSLNRYSNPLHSSHFCGLPEDLNRSISSSCTANSMASRHASRAAQMTQDSGLTVSHTYTLEPSKNSINSIRRQTSQLNLCQGTYSISGIPEGNLDINYQLKLNARSFKQPWSNNPSSDYVDWTMPLCMSVARDEILSDAVRSAAQVLKQQPLKQELMNGISLGKSILSLFRRMRRRQFAMLQRLL